MSVFQEGDIKFEEVPNLGAEREDLLKNAPNPVLARDWLANALSEGTRVHDAYRKGRFPLGVDVVNLLYGFDYEHLKCPGLAANEIQERRRRAYHRLLGHLLASYEYTAAAKVASNLRDAEEGFWLSYRHLFLWRLLAGTVAGSIALGGSSTWREMTVALARGPACCVVTLSLLLILAPAVLTEWFQAPPHALQHMWKRLRIVWFNAFGIVFLVGGVEWLLKVVVQPSGDSWKDAGNWKYHLMSASVSLSIGYVVNLIWRERSIAGPG